jgi:twitching motility protein PilT
MDQGSNETERLLRLAASRGASELFLTSQSRPYVRVDGDLGPLEGEAPLAAGDVDAAICEVAPEAVREAARRGEGVEWQIEAGDLAGVRCASFRDHRGPGLLVRLATTRAMSAEQLGLAREVQALATEPDGLVLVAGPRGSGRSTLLAAFVDAINHQRADYIITLEPQVRLVHENEHALISQRAVRPGADAAAAASAALREEPDVLVIEELDSPELASIALDAAEQGLLVLASMVAVSTTDAVARFVNLVPEGARPAARARLAAAFRGAVAQVLLRKSGGGRLAARELLLGSGQVTRLIADGPLGELAGALDAGRRFGMASLTDALVGYVHSGAVDVREAYRKAPDRERLLAGLTAAGADTTAIDRLT